MSRTTHKIQAKESPLAGTTLADGIRVTVVSTDAAGGFQVSPADETDLLAAIAEADAGQTIPADEVLRHLTGR